MTLITPTVISSASFAENKNKKSAEKAADGNRYSIKLEEYLNAGERRNKKKAEAIANGIKILLNNSLELKEYINKAINKKVENVTVAYGKVNKRCVSDVKEISNGKIDVTDYFLELVPSDLEHAWQEHHKAKESGDIPLSQKDFENIPNYFENYDEMVYAIQFASGNKKLCVSKKIKDGRMVIVEVVSKSRGSLQFKNAIGMTEEKYQKIFLPKYKRSSSSSRGSDSSNTSLHNDTASNTRIAQKDSSVNTEFMQNSQNNSEAKKFLKVLDTEYLNATESGDVETAQRLVDEVGKAKNDGLYHIVDFTSANFKIKNEDVLNEHSQEAKFSRHHTSSDTRIAQKDSSVNAEFMQDSQNNSEIKKSLKAEDDAPSAIDRYYAEAIRVFR